MHTVFNEIQCVNFVCRASQVRCAVPPSLSCRRCADRCRLSQFRSPTLITRRTATEARRSLSVMPPGTRSRETDYGLTVITLLAFLFNLKCARNRAGTGRVDDLNKTIADRRNVRYAGRCCRSHLRSSAPMTQQAVVV